MNFIKQLQEETQEKSCRIIDAQEKINETLRYLNSDKFRCGNALDGYVNISDVYDRIMIIRNILA